MQSRFCDAIEAMLPWQKAWGGCRYLVFSHGREQVALFFWPEPSHATSIAQLSHKQQETKQALTATSTISAAIKLIPSNPLRMVLNSLVDHPPVSGVPVAGATISCQPHPISTPLLSRPRQTQEKKPKKRKLTSRIQSINIQTQINRILRPHPLLYPVNNPLGPNDINFTGLDNLKPAIPIILIVARPAKRGANARVDIGVVAEEAFLRGVVEVRAVVDGGYFGGGTAEDFGPPFFYLNFY
jgi:hypothetical protein